MQPYYLKLCYVCLDSFYGICFQLCHAKHKIIYGGLGWKREEEEESHRCKDRVASKDTTGREKNNRHRQRDLYRGTGRQRGKQRESGWKGGAREREKTEWQRERQRYTESDAYCIFTLVCGPWEGFSGLFAVSMLLRPSVSQQTETEAPSRTGSAQIHSKPISVSLSGKRTWQQLSHRCPWLTAALHSYYSVP